MIHCENGRETLTLREVDERRIREIHRAIRIARHERLCRAAPVPISALPVMVAAQTLPYNPAGVLRSIRIHTRESPAAFQRGVPQAKLLLVILCFHCFHTALA
jgi:hypothetical protein